MAEKELSFVDENGELRPWEEVSKDIKEIYDEAMENKSCNCNNPLCEDSVLSELIDPELQVDGTQAVETLNFLQRTLYLCDEIKPEAAVAFSDAIRFWNSVDEMDGIPPEERQPIKIYIDSPGGDLDATFSIIDSIRLSKTPVWTVTIGSGCSGGFFIGIAGHKRYGYPHSSYLFHEGCAQSGGDAHKYLQGVEFYKKKLAMLKKITLEYTNISEDEYKKHKKDDLWMTADEALKCGVIDEIMTELM